MRQYSFTLILSGDVFADGVIDALFEAGCDDGTFGTTKGISHGDFNRVAKSFEAAVESATKDVESVDGLTVTQVGE